MFLEVQNDNTAGREQERWGSQGPYSQLLGQERECGRAKARGQQERTRRQGKAEVAGQQKYRVQPTVFPVV